MIGLEFETYTVNEENAVNICARVINGTLSSAITLQLSTASPLNSETPGIIYCISDVVLLILQFIAFISATANVDYSSVPGGFTSGRLTLSTFSTLQCVSIGTISDSLVEATEDFLVQLRTINPLPPFVKLARTNATVFILDNDGMYTI